MSVPWMVVTGLVVLLIGAPAAQAHHTPPPSTVALVGSLQSELGCPGDWQPECPQTRLQPVAGSPGAFRASFDVPQGELRLQGRAQQHVGRELRRGGAPGGANIALTARGGTVTFTYDHATHVIGDDAPRPLQDVRGGALVADRRDRLAAAGRRPGATGCTTRPRAACASRTA